ncbi:MlaD family protein [Patulibacter brassicae]|uniref:MlaD family protein n=1 Tax=Patulibacter brassicae TaxID=1705717 RepID=A0ABU4VPK0_9ACTN|nr:MlaD family protein [Patulibacter brassicae]MDX8153777.1 MlaD family protein [Patulibacter brassicae]
MNAIVKGRGQRRPGQHLRRHQLLAAGVLAAVVAAALLVAFGRSAFQGGTELRAVFADANQLKAGSAVRVGGLDIGRVTSIEIGADDRALVTMHLKGDAPTIHDDARLDVEPRLAFEGNFYVRVDPGSTRRPALRDGDVVGVRQTSHPVQLDEVLSTFDAPVRRRARDAVGGLAAGLGDGRSATPAAGRTTGARALRTATDELSRALAPAGRVSAALRGRRRGDLRRAMQGTTAFTDALARDPAVLAGLVTSYERTVAAFADHDAALSASIRNAATTLRTAPASLTKIDAALPRVRELSRALRPTLRALPDSQRDFTAALREFGRFVEPAALPRLLSRLDEPVRSLPALEERLAFLLPLVTPIGQCFSRQIVPTLNDKVYDGPLTIDQPVWKQLLHTLASLTGASSDFDANGTTIRAGLGTGDNVFQATIPGLGEMIQAGTQGAVGMNPPWLGYDRQPAKRPDQWCAAQGGVNLRSTPVPFERSGLRRVPAPQSTMTLEQRQAENERVLRDARRALAGAEDAEATR